jgi:DNA-binding transcriptional MerR regulator
MSSLEKERGSTYVGLPEFAAVAERVLSELDFEQERGTVSPVPDERTIRYYLSEGLITAPEEKQGTASVFTYINLLQVVAVKKLQAEHLPIRKIRELVKGKSEQELESLLGVGSYTSKKTQKSEAKQYLESLLAPSLAKSFDSDAVVLRNTSREPSLFEDVQLGGLPAQAPEATLVWQRVEIEPGLELHIRSDYRVPTTSAGIRSVAERIRRALRLYWKEKQ